MGVVTETQFLIGLRVLRGLGRRRGRLLKFENLELTGEGPRRYFSHNLNQTFHRSWFTRTRSVQGYRN
jgi:hypothetical protein